MNIIINLDTHICYVIDFILKNKISNVILCGHNYAGMGVHQLSMRHTNFTRLLKDGWPFGPSPMK